MSTGERHRTLDIVRGVAVIGILVVNIGDFAMPSAARLNPTAWGGTDPVNLALWALNWVAFDNKMRGLFSLLFGASLLLVADRARASGRNVWAVQGPRLAVLLALGAAHYVLLWDGDILMLYALVGLIALPYSRQDQHRLSGAAVTTLLLAGVLMALSGAASMREAGRLGGPAIAVRQQASIKQDRATAALPWDDRIRERARELVGTEPANLLFSAPDTLGLMLLGMVLLRAGLLTGRWTSGRAWAWARRAALVGGLPLCGLAAWLRMSGFPQGQDQFAYFALAYPFNIALTVAWAAGLSAWASAATGWLARALEATGRAAFTNYIATSLVMTTLFYGYGGGLYGRVDRAEGWLIVLAAAALMLAWSRPWLARYRFGPLEWVWRSAARGRLQPMAGGALARRC